MNINKRFSLIGLLLASSIVSLGCVGKDAVKAGTIDATLLPRLETIEDMTNKLVDWQQSIQAETINYGGAGWTAVGSSLMATIFLVAIGWYIRQAMKKKTDLLKLVTCAVSKTSPAARKAIKDQIEHEVTNGGPFKQTHKQQLAKFTKQHGTFAEA